MQLINETNGLCAIGALLMENVGGECAASALENERAALEEALRARYSGVSRAELKQTRPLESYVRYYKKYGYSYHVLAQLESVAKGKSIPSALPLVEAMFMAELKNALLTAGHDADSLSLPLRAQICGGSEEFTVMGGRETLMVKNDVMLTDGSAPISSILRGPDARTAITAQSRRALYIVYAPQGIDHAAVLSHLCDIERFVSLAYPNAKSASKQIFA